MSDTDIAAVTRTEPGGQVRIDLALDAAAADRVGVALAEAARELGATAVANPDTTDDAVLGHVVARHLGLPRTSIDVDLGLMTLEPAPPPGSRVLLVTTDLTAHEPLAAFAGLISGHGSALAGAGYLLGDDGAAGIHTRGTS